MYEWSDMTAADLGRGVADKSIDPVELTRYFLEMIVGTSEANDIFVAETALRAQLEAMASRGRQKMGTLMSPLDGVPVSWKDLYDTMGDLTQSGAPLLAGRRSEKDAQVVSLAGEAGMVCLGKTHQTEFAFSGLGINPNTATPPNKDFEDCCPGGSSSGAGASVTYGLAPIAIGSDTGGSVRIPSCWNSLVGLKTTHGLISTKGVIPLCSGFDTVGPLAKSVEDAGLMLEVLGGGKVSFNQVPDSNSLKFVVAEGIPLSDCENEVIAEFEQAVKRLSNAGVTIERKDFSKISEALSIAGPMFTFEAWREWGELIEENPGVMYSPVEERFRGGIDVSEKSYLEAWDRLKQLRDGFWDEVSKFDGILMPTTPMRPPQVQPLLDDDDLFVSTNLLALRNTRIGNLMGACALTLPTSEKGIGLQLMSNPRSDAKLVTLGLAVERLVAGY